MTEEQCNQCSKCKSTLPFSQFYKDKNNKLGLSSHCKECKNNYTKERRNNILSTDNKPPSDKCCPRCKLIKPSDCFTKLKTTKDKLSVYCKECRRLQDKERKQNVIQTPVNVNNTLTKTCTTCNVLKTYNEFRINRKSCDNLSHICIQCLPTNNWNIDKQRASEKKYRINNPEKMKEKYRKQSQNMNRRVRDSMNHRISEALFTNKITKRNKTCDYIGCNILFLRGWIESQFQEGMSWSNYGMWHLDHVKPCASFDLCNPEEVKACFLWKNIQPLWASDNLKKSDKVSTQFIELHYEKANNYEINTLLPV